jgi:transcriptional regulator with GAF, ATPase, and Fis domain
MQRDRNKELHFLENRLNQCVVKLDKHNKIDFTDEMRRMKKDLVEWAMSEAQNNISQAARMLKMKRTTVQSIILNDLCKIKEE